MANFFSASFWKARFFKAFGVQGEADPNAMSGSFAGSSSWTGTLTGEGTEEVRSRSLGGFDPYYYKKRKKKQPEPVSKDFGDDWQPPTPRPAIPPLPAPQEIFARQDAALAQTWQQFADAIEAMERQRAEAARLALEQEDEDEAILLLMAA